MRVGGERESWRGELEGRVGGERVRQKKLLKCKTKFINIFQNVSIPVLILSICIIVLLSIVSRLK